MSYWFKKNIRFSGLPPSAGSSLPAAICMPGGWAVGWYETFNIEWIEIYDKPILKGHLVMVELMVQGVIKGNNKFLTKATKFI